MLNVCESLWNEMPTHDAYYGHHMEHATRHTDNFSNFISLYVRSSHTSRTQAIPSLQAANGFSVHGHPSSELLNLQIKVNYTYFLTNTHTVQEMVNIMLRCLVLYCREISYLSRFHCIIKVQCSKKFTFSAFCSNTESKLTEIMKRKRE